MTEAATPPAGPALSVSPAPPASPAPPTQAVVPSEGSASPATGAPVAPGKADSSALFPGLDLDLQDALPGAAHTADLFRLLPVTALDDAYARELASRLGVEGAAYSETEAPASRLVWSGGQQLRIFDTHPFFDLYFQPPALAQEPNCAPPCTDPDAAGVVEQYLKDKDLLDFEYGPGASLALPGGVELTQLLDGAPLVAPGGPAIRALTDTNGAMLWLRYRRLQLEPARRAQLASAQQGWQSLLAGKAGVIFNEYPAGSPDRRSWTRRYPGDTDQTIFGYAQTFEPPAAGSEALILLNDYPVAGATQGLAQAAAGGRLVQAWGRVETDPQRGPQLKLSGWQASVFPEQTVTGRLERAGDSAYLAAGEKRYLLPDAPAGLPAEGAWLTARGVLPDDSPGSLEWYTLTEGPAQPIRVGGPGFHPVSLDIQDPAATPAPLTGRVEGAVGVPQVIAHAYSDGSTQVEVQITFTAQDGKGRPAQARLDGAGLQGIEAYQNLPVRLWGQAGETVGGLARVEVERFEAVYPDVHVQAWLGLPKKTRAAGQEVWLLTTPTGESFVLASTLAGKTPPVEPALLNDPVIVEGVQIPGETLLDFPVISDLVILPGVGHNDLEGYQPASTQPRIIQEPGAAGARRVAHIEAVDLVYVLTTDAGLLASTLQTVALAQPAWRFSGRFEDGAYFEIFVQALFEV